MGAFALETGLNKDLASVSLNRARFGGRISYTTQNIVPGTYNVHPDACNPASIVTGPRPRDFVAIARIIVNDSHGVDQSELQVQTASGKKLSKVEILLPDDIHFIEDPRIVRARQRRTYPRNNKVGVGVTAVDHSRPGRDVTYHPAFFLGELKNQHLIPNSPLVVFRDMVGKNMTFDNYEGDEKSGEINFRTRPDDKNKPLIIEQYTYAYSGDVRKGRLTQRSDISVPTTSDLEIQIGTVGAMVEGYGLYHNQQLVLGADGKLRRKYGLKAVHVDDSGQITHITPQPIHERKDIAIPFEEDRHTADKEIVYSTDTHRIIETPRGRYWQLLTSSGDKRWGVTYFSEEDIFNKLAPVEQIVYPQSLSA